MQISLHCRDRHLQASCASPGRTFHRRFRNSGTELPMSEVKLNIVDAQRISSGTVHGSIADACVAALSAEPETVAELEAALTRYVKSLNESGALGTLRS